MAVWIIQKYTRQKPVTRVSSTFRLEGELLFTEISLNLPGQPAITLSGSRWTSMAAETSVIWEPPSYCLFLMLSTHKQQVNWYMTLMTCSKTVTQEFRQIAGHCLVTEKPIPTRINLEQLIHKTWFLSPTMRNECVFTALETSRLPKVLISGGIYGYEETR